MKKTYSRQMVHPVALISTREGDTENIATMAWLSPVSFDPPLLMVAVSPRRFTHDLVLKSGEFAIMILSANQKELATLAGTRTGRKTNKWDLPEFRRLRKAPRQIGAPLLSECRASYECRLVQHFTTGDHTLFIGEVLEAEAEQSLNPLILFNRHYYDLGRLIGRYP